MRFFVTPTVIQQNENNVNNQCASTCQTTGSMNKPKRRVEKPSFFMVTGGEGHLVNSHKDSGKFCCLLEFLTLTVLQ